MLEEFLIGMKKFIDTIMQDQIKTKVILIISILFFFLSLFVMQDDLLVIGVIFSFVPLWIFSLLDTKESIRWVLGFFVVFLTVMTVIWMKGTETSFDMMTLVKMSGGYFAVSLIVYFIIQKEKKSNAAALSKSLAIQKVLLKEVHHRTKNNMQVMIGLLELQLFKIKDSYYKQIFDANIRRIQTISFAYDHFDASGTFEYVDMCPYIDAVISSIQVTLPYPVSQEIECINLDLQTATNMGLIINEALGNSIEYMNIGSEVSLKPLEGKRYRLLIKNHSYTKSKDYSKGYTSLGLTLMEDFGASLPNSSVEIDNNNGIELKIDFDLK